MTEIIYQTHVKYQYLTELENKNFNTDERTLIDLVVKNDEGDDIEDRIKPNLILFIEENKLSKDFLKIFLQLAKQIKNDKCELCYCNLEFEKNILNNFKKLNDKENLDHPFKWAAYVETPFILGYKEGWPVGFFNYSFDVQTLIEFCNDYMVFGGKKLSKEYKYRPENVDFNKEKSIKALQYIPKDYRSEYSKDDQNALNEKIQEEYEKEIKNANELKKVQNKEYEGDYSKQTVAFEY